MSDRASALGPENKPGQYGDLSNGVGVHLSETRFAFVGELASLAHAAQMTGEIVKKACKEEETSAAFKIAANRWFLAGSSELRDRLVAKTDPANASLIDLTHGRTSLLVSGPKAEWVLSKLFAVDFRQKAFPVDTGLTTMHHDTFAQIHRPYERTFDIFIHRSFARSYWHTLCRAAEEVGYEVA